MTPTQIKDVILSVAKTTEICDAYQQILLAVTEQDIIDAGIAYAEWAYRSGIINDALLAEFDQLNLNANQIYLSGVHILNNPSGDVYVFGTANVTINMNGSSNCRVFGFSTSVININLSDQAFVKCKIFNAGLNLQQFNESSSCVEVNDSSTSQIQTSNTSVSHIRTYSNVQLNLVSNNSSYILVQAFFNSVLSGVQNDTSIINITTNQQAQNNVVAP